MERKRHLAGALLRRVRREIAEGAFRALRGHGGDIADRFAIQVATLLGRLRDGHSGLNLSGLDVAARVEGCVLNLAVHLPGVADRILRLAIPITRPIVPANAPDWCDRRAPEN